MKRLLFLVPLFAGTLLAAASCSSSDDDDAPAPTPDEADVDTRPPTPPEWDRAVTRPDEAAAAADRAACKFGRGSLAGETLGASIPVGEAIPIDTIVVLMQENRSFDHYFGGFNAYAGRSDVEVAAQDATNPLDPANPDAGAVTRKRAEHMCFTDTNHSWSGSHAQYDDGKMDGFVKTNAKDGVPGDRALWWYDEQELPFYYALAKEFGLADHYHCALLGPTWPNRMYLASGTSFGHTSNSFPDLTAYPFPDNDATIFDELEKRHVDWMFFTDGGPPGASVVVGPALGTRWQRDVVNTIEEFEAAAKAGTLPSVSFVDANFLDEGAKTADEHPPGDVQVGQKFTARIVRAMFTSPQWKSSALFITYDEHGGIYDHVPPPKACPPDDKTPIDSDGKPMEGAFDRYGFRVPLIVVSPFTKKGYVSHTVYSHTSLLRFIEARFRVPALTARDANESIPIDFFDFQNPPNLTPPALPEPTVDQAKYDYCVQTFAQ